MSDIHHQYTYKGVEVEPADMVGLRQIIELYEQKNPPPTPPMVQIRTFESVSSGKGFDEVEDKSDEGYIAATKQHERQIYRIMELFFIRNCVQNPESLASVLNNEQDRLGLFRYILNISEITQEAVAQAMRKFRIYVARKTHRGLRLINEPRRDAAARISLFGRTKAVRHGTLGLRRISC